MPSLSLLPRQSESELRSLCESGSVTFRTSRPGLTMSAHRGILLQKSKVASVRIFGETLRLEAIDDSDNFSRATEVAYEFSVRR
jgi:hypothetical protein